MSGASDDDFMGVAVALAARGAGQTMPNPSVGCVIVRDGRVLARARTSNSGRPHAEAGALSALNGRATGATAYVTLEPCSHHGQTPPCAQALIEAGISRCVIARLDPDPRVSGRGVAALKAAGIEVVTGVMAETATETLSGYLSRQTLGRPEVLLKLATTLDGKIATSAGESRWITGPDARRMVHLMRSRSEGVLIGIGTALADDPMLDVRDMGAIAQPIRIVLDSRLRLPATSRLASTAKDHPLWLMHGPTAPTKNRETLTQAGANLIEVPTTRDGELDVPAALNLLAAKGMSTVLCEGGAGVAATLLRDGLADQLAVFTAGKAIGAEGIGAIGPLELNALADAPKFTLTELRSLGGDTLSLWRAENCGSSDQETNP